MKLEVFERFGTRADKVPSPQFPTESTQILAVSEAVTTSSLWAEVSWPEPLIMLNNVRYLYLDKEWEILQKNILSTGSKKRPHKCVHWLQDTLFPEISNPIIDKQGLENQARSVPAQLQSSL